MVYFKNLNSDEVAFLRWVKEFPNSSHPLDRLRFFGFVHTVVGKKKYQKWLRKKYFYKRCSKYIYDNERIEYFYSCLKLISEYRNSGSDVVFRTSYNLLDDDNGIKFVITYAKNDEILSIETKPEDFRQINTAKQFLAIYESKKK